MDKTKRLHNDLTLCDLGRASHCVFHLLIVPCDVTLQSVDVCVSPDLYCTLEVDSYGYFVSKAKTRVFRDTTEPTWNEVRREQHVFILLSSLYFKLPYHHHI